VRKLNIVGDAPGDLAGHGGEHRAVFVYQMDSYHYWERFLGRNDFTFGKFGENFTIEGLLLIITPLKDQNGFFRVNLNTKALSHGFTFGVVTARASFVNSQRRGSSLPSILMESISDG